MPRILLTYLYELEKIDGCFAEGHDPDGPRKYLRMNRLLDFLDYTENLGGELDRNKCIVKVSGKRACLADKIDLWSNEQARKELNF